MSFTPANRPLLFVYGTLKRGRHNHGLMEELEAEFVTRARTVESFPLVVQGLPYLLDAEGRGQRVGGEIYRMDSEGWRYVDRLEGHPHFYCRRLIRVEGEDGASYEAWCYFVTDPPESLHALEALAEF
jgi:gamma-glutamylaminecyclotransferase